MIYLSLKALHIISVVCWFAGLFYLPRLFVYHAQSEDLISQSRFKVMERRLYYGIMMPSMVTTLFSGILLIALDFSIYLNQGWLHLKLLLVMGLIVYHYLCGVKLKKFSRSENEHTHVYFRWFNEIPVLFLCSVVTLVVFKPLL